MRPEVRSDLLKWFALAADASCAAEERLEAAADVVWAITSDADTDNAVETLCRAVVSRVVDGICRRHGFATRFEDCDYWRDFELSDDVAPENLTPSQCAVLAQLLFEGARHREAAPYFAAVLSAQPDGNQVVLACYNDEVLGRADRDLVAVERALDNLENRFAHLLAHPRFESEIDHLAGHLSLLKGRFMPTETLGFEKLGVDRLERAARSDPSYTGCYASSMAEYGDFLGSISVCLDVLKFETYPGLSAADAELVALEVLFYLGYSLMAVGELERSRVCFDRFAKAAERLELLEARDHAQLFLVKLELKRRSLLDTEDRHMDAAHRRLRSLSFQAALSMPVERECRRYEVLTEFLQGVVRLRRNENPSAASLRNLAQRAEGLLSELSVVRPDLIGDMRVVILSFSASEEDCRLVSEGVAAAMSSVGLVDVQVTDGLEHGGMEDLLDSRTVAVIAQPDGDDTSFELRHDIGGSHPGPIAADLLVVLLTIVAARRYLAEDEYVFGMVPCLESPATKFQHPAYSLESVL